MRAAQAPTAQESGQTLPSFPSSVELITVDVVVVDKQGHTVPGLSRDDFVLEEDGKPQEIVGFEAFALGSEEAAAPAALGATAAAAVTTTGSASFAIVIDDLRIPTVRAGEARRAAERFVDRSLRPGDEVSVGTTSGDIWWSARLPQGREDIAAVLSRVKGRYVEAMGLDRMTEYEAYWITAHEDEPSQARLLPDVPAGVPGAVATPDPNPARSSIKERVKARWKDMNLCTGTSCDGMVRGRAADIDMARRNRSRLTLAAMRRAVDALSAGRGRKSLLFLSEGLIDDGLPEFRKVVADAREANAAVYFFDIRGLVAMAAGGDASDPEQYVDPNERVQSGFEVMNEEITGAVSLADQTGGFVVRNTNDFTAGADRIADESRVFYLLGFYPPEGKAVAKWRNIKVKAKKAGLTVRARRGYTLRSPVLAEEKADKKKGKGPIIAPAVAKALDSAHEASAIPLRMQTWVLEPRPNDAIHVVALVELDAGALPASKGRSRLDLSIVATHRDTGLERRADELIGVSNPEGEKPAWRGYVRDFELPAGIAQLRAVVLDPATGHVGSITERLEVPAPGRLRLSTPILTDRLEPGSEKEAHPRPALTAERWFKPAGRLYCQYEVFGAARPNGAAPRVLASLAIRGGDGTVVRQAPPSAIAADADGRIVRFLGIPLDGLGEGVYELVIDVQDQASGSWITRRVSFVLSSSPAAS